MIKTFDELGMDERLIEGLKKQGITEPTPIQADTVKLALENKDIVGQSPTGSGKTLAFLLPIFQRVDAGKRENQAIVLEPTHELVMQIEKQARLLAANSGIAVTSAAIIGEVNITRQIEKLREKPNIIIGSAGRVLELIKRRKINAQTVRTIVIDEGDRMLDEHNLGTVREVIKTTLRDRQLMVFSATIGEKALSTAREFMKDPQVVRIEDRGKISPDIRHIYLAAEKRDKIEVLRKLAASMKPERAIVFINKSEELQLTAAKLKYHHLSACDISGSSSKEERKKALEGFRKGDIKLLVASDIAARGLDIKGVTHIFNLDLPEDPKGYLHRAGRTGRMGEPGTVVSIVTEREVPFLRKCERDLKIKIYEKIIARGKVLDPPQSKTSAGKGAGR
ncbi:MAG TPA: DEAD/DEAH box helicase [Bacillota bacterium]|nr:DEAD/DEAH box helicase [Clostridiaceae bacterium]HNR03232.1 DEAD/DEAH box helicase [Bacillota bacterium]HNT02967.1 DEAD/DEAH box helicase [Bacillota bacterium]HPA54593.1 DEAD/DEAH box helicase [Bacillota bacterium]HPX67773.1 DEAD/DEAH box helicase [Bacillota bacterium]